MMAAGHKQRGAKVVRKLLWVVGVAVLGALLVGCGSLEERKQMNAFKKDTRDYGRLLRWRGYEGAAQFLRTPDGAPIAVSTRGLGDIRVTSYEIVRSELAPDAKSATVAAVIDYYNERENRIRTLSDQQHWWYDEQAEKWYLDGNLPPFVTVESRH
jgi:hypothetical protein